MGRIEDSPELFGAGCGISTIGSITCEWCGNTYHEDNEDEDGDIIDNGVESICFTEFAGKQICDCCYEKIESEILRRMKDVLIWYRHIQDTRRNQVENTEVLLQAVERGSAVILGPIGMEL